MTERSNDPTPTPQTGPLSRRASVRRSELTPALSFTRLENAALLASVSASLQLLEEVEVRAGIPHGSAWATLNSLRTLFAENAYAFERNEHG